MQHVLRTTALCALFAIALPVAAADDGTIVVTATRTPTRASALLNDLSVITRDQIEQGAQSTLVQLLQAQPGLQILTQNGGPGTTSSISIRGATAQQTLVLIDGQRMSSATVGSTALENIPINQVDHIEILRGPASALYGADAIGGVIQIFTRQGSGAPHLSAEAGLGTYRTATGSVGYGGKINDTSFNVNYGYTHSGSFSATRPGAFGFNPDRDPYTNENVSAQIGQRLNADHELGGRLFYSRGKTHFDTSNCDVNFITCTNDFDNYQTQALSSYALYTRNRFLPNWTSQLRLGRSRDDLTSYFLDPTVNTVSGQTFRTTQDQLSWQNDIAFNSGKLMLAAERLKEAVDSNSVVFTVDERHTDSAIVGYQGSIGDHSLQLSGRHDRNTQFGSSNTGSLAYGYQFSPAWRASASAGTAFRAPTFADLFWPVDFSSFYVGNPNLHPERARNRELGLVYAAATQRIAVTAYDNRVHDLIGFGNAAAPAFFITTVNVGSAVLKGATTTYDGGFGNWKLSASYDLLSARDADSGHFLIRRAKNSGAAGMRYDAGRWDAGVQLVASGARWVDTANTQRTGGFTLINVDGKYAIDKDWALFARANNLFDRKYTLVQGFNTPGANLFVGVRYATK